MSMPIIVPGTGTRDQAITDVIESVALEETALSHILNAEGEKLQAVIAMPGVTADELLIVNKSVQKMVNAITRLETILQGKIDIFSCEICPNPQA
ncbi:MAG: hypothetical protein RR922_01530 [Clostridia bacterium]